MGQKDELQDQSAVDLENDPEEISLEDAEKVSGGPGSGATGS